MYRSKEEQQFFAEKGWYQGEKAITEETLLMS
jgi:hypothetical protein